MAEVVTFEHHWLTDNSLAIVSGRDRPYQWGWRYVIGRIMLPSARPDQNDKAAQRQHVFHCLHIHTIGFDYSVQRTSFSVGSGLLFSGANNILTGKEIPGNIDDGVLTAEEISRIDLRGLDLLVLSACQTGLGEISGEGVFGLQRGFKKAGAQSILMSLWSVDDKATQLFMAKFYEFLLKDKNKHNAYLKAQLFVKDYETDINRLINSFSTGNAVKNGVGIGLSATAVLILSNMLISLLRKLIPEKV